MKDKVFHTELLSQQVKEHIAREIASGKYNQTLKLPSEDGIASELGVSRLTVRHALASLAKEGLILRKRGIGTLINPQAVRLKARLDYHMECTELLKNNGYEVTVSVVEVGRRKPEPEIAEHLQAGGLVWTINKVWHADGKPAIYIEDTIPSHLVADECLRDIASETIFHVLEACSGEEYAYDVTSVWTETAGAAGDRVAELLQVEAGHPLMILEQVGYNADSTPILHSREFYRSGFFRFSLVRTRI